MAGVAAGTEVRLMKKGGRRMIFGLTPQQNKQAAGLFRSAGVASVEAEAQLGKQPMLVTPHFNPQGRRHPP